MSSLGGGKHNLGWNAELCCSDRGVGEDVPKSDIRVFYFSWPVEEGRGVTGLFYSPRPASRAPKVAAGAGQLRAAAVTVAFL